MFDFEKQEMIDETVAMSEFEWEGITKKHADDAKEVSPDRIYRKAHAKRKDRTGISAARYAVLAIGLTAIGWAVRDITGLAITLGVIALFFAMIAAFGAGKYREM